MTDAAPTLEFDAVTKRFGGVRALDDVSLTVSEGECVALVGESGSGKTTLLRCANRLTEPDAGVVRLDGRDVRDRDAVRLRRAIGYVPQEGGLLPHWRVRRNVALVPWLAGSRDAEDRADRALALVGLDPALIGDRWPHELSGGQRQRAAVARAMAGGQRLMLLDEPFGALDAITRSDLQRMLRALHGDESRTIVIVTHDLGEAFLLADRVAVLRAGRLEQVAPPARLRAEPATPYVAELLRRAGVAA